MNKKVIASISGALTLLSLASCGSSVSGTNYNGTYWNKDASNQIVLGQTETLEYKVYSSSGKDLQLWNEGLTNETLSFKTVNEISKSVVTKNEADGAEKIPCESTYKTEITVSDDGLYYVYKTTLNVYGAYTVNSADGSEQVTEVCDVTETETVLKMFEDGFAPVSSIKRVDNVYPSSYGGTQFLRAAYVSTIMYEGTTAKESIEILEGDTSPEQFKERAEKDIEIKKYNKSAYIDNSLIIPLFRNFKYSANMSYSFRSIEPLSGEIMNVSGAVHTKTITESNSSSLEYLDVCVLNGVKLGNHRYDRVPFDVVRVDFSTTGTTGQTFMRAFYAENYEQATDKNAARHIPVMIAQPTIFNTGFLVYEIYNASFM